MERLTQQEELIMIYIWQLNSCTIKEIREHMDEPKQNYTTIASVCKNLERKNYVSVKRNGLAQIFSPKVSEVEYKRHFLSNVIRNYFDNSYREMVSFFAEEKKLTSEDLSEIIRLIEDKR